MSADCDVCVRRVWGVGMSKASDLFAKGFSTVDELRTPEGIAQLNRLQKLGLKYHEDLILRIPRDEITAMVELIREVAESVVADKTGLRVVGVGSYRRGKKESGDCDVLVSHTDGVSHVVRRHSYRWKSSGLHSSQDARDIVADRACWRSWWST